MTKKKEYKTFAFMDKQGKITIKKRFEIVQKMDFNDFKVSFNKGKPIHIDKFRNRWVMLWAYETPITKKQAKKEILQSLLEPLT